MRFWLLTLVVVLAASVGAGSVAYLLARQEPPRTSGHALDWLKLEFKLSSEQAERIAALHRDYSLKCEEHCLAIQRARRQLRILREQGRPAAEIAEAVQRLEEADRHCRTSMELHVQEVAKLMGAEGPRYLQIVLPRIESFDHAASPDLSITPNSSQTHGHSR
jgi:uncharacterized membrane protein